MSKMNELDLCIGELRNAAEALTAASISLKSLFSSHDTTEMLIFTQNGDDNAQIGSMEAPTLKPKTITLEQVRAVLAEKSRSGHTAQVRMLLEKHGAAKLSEIDSAEYAALLAEAEVLGDG